MSYILDALKKSELERARGALPGVSMAPTPDFKAHAGTEFSRGRWMAIGFVAIAVLTAAFAWQRMHSPMPSSPAAGLPEQGYAGNSEASQSRREMPIVPAQPVVKLVVQDVSTLASGPRKSSMGESAKPTLDKKNLEQNAAAKHRVKPAVQVTGPAPVKKAEPLDVAPPSAESRIGTLRELPENIQKNIPVIAFAGYIYSNNPSDRSVLISNRLLREGDQIMPGLTLEKMLPKEAIFNYLGYRYRVPY